MVLLKNRIMKRNHLLFTSFTILSMTFISCNSSNKQNNSSDTTSTDSSHYGEYGSLERLAEPFSTEPKNKFSKILGWGPDQAPTAPDGFEVVRFADSLNSPRHVYVAPNGDIFVAQARTEKEGEDAEKIDSRNAFRDKSPNEIILFKDTDNDGKHDSQQVILKDLKQPFGMLVLGKFFYVANTDGLIRYGYNPEDGTLVSPQGEQILTLPAGGYNNHWTRNLISNKAGDKIFISVGSGSNVGENGMEYEERRAVILEVNPDGSGERIYASGLRNPVGMDLNPQTGILWTAVNERDELGDEIVPDYITEVKLGGFYGWPYYYWGNNVDPRWKDSIPNNIPDAIRPDYAVGSHTASLGLAFNKAPGFPEGAFVGQHGSWNRSEFSGYKVIFVPFSSGKPSGEPTDFLTGFIANKENNEVYGRPVSVAFTKNYMLVTDDAANIIWSVIKK
jgi:glucose/arabinose dehydrogenase